MTIGPDTVATADLRELLASHLRDMGAKTPPECVHALGLEAYADPRITLYAARQDGVLWGCGALKELAPDHGEIKSMRTAPDRLRQGVARAVLDFLLAEARRRGYRRVSLETGSSESFRPARTLYEQTGFRPCAPFADYAPDPISAFFTMELA